MMAAAAAAAAAAEHGGRGGEEEEEEQEQEEQEEQERTTRAAGARGVHVRRRGRRARPRRDEVRQQGQVGPLRLARHDLLRGARPLHQADHAQGARAQARRRRDHAHRRALPGARARARRGEDGRRRDSRGASSSSRRRAREEDGAQGGLARDLRRRRVGLDGAQPNERRQGRGGQPARRGLPVARQDLAHLLPGRLRAGRPAADALDRDGEEPPRAHAVRRRLAARARAQPGGAGRA